MKKVLSLILPIVLITGLLSGCIFDNNISEAQAYNGFVSVDINPSVQFILNEEDEVIGVSASNEDGETILLGHIDELLGMYIEEATQKIVELAIEYGYLDPEALETDPSAVTITTVLENASKELEGRLRDKVKNHINSFFKNNGIFGVVLTEEDMHESFSQAEELGVSLGHYKLIKSVQAVNDDYTLEQLAQKPRHQLMNMLKERDHNHIEEYIAYKQERIEALEGQIEVITGRVSEITAILAADEIALATLEAINVEVMNEAELAEHNFNIDTLENAILDYNQELEELNAELVEYNEDLVDYQAALEEKLAELEAKEQEQEQKRLEAKESYDEWQENKEERAENTKNRWHQFQENLTEEQKNALIDYAREHFGAGLDETLNGSTVS